MRCRYGVNHLKELDPSFLLSLNVLLNLAVRFHPNTAKRCYIFLFVLRLCLRIGQLYDSQTRVPQTPRQCHQLRQREGHHRRLALTCPSNEKHSFVTLQFAMRNTNFRSAVELTRPQSYLMCSIKYFNIL